MSDIRKLRTTDSTCLQARLNHPGNKRQQTCILEKSKFDTKSDGLERATPLNVVFFFSFLCWVLRIQVLYGGETWTQTQIQTCFRFIRRLFFPNVTKKVEDLQVPFSPHHSFDGCCFHSEWLVPIHYEWDYLKIFGYPPWLDCQTAKL